MKSFMRIYYKLALLLTGGTLLFSSCEKYIDIDEYVYDKMTIDSIFVSKARILEYINGTASLLKDESNFVGDWDIHTFFPSGMGSDEAIQPWIDNNHPGSALVVDAIDPRNTRGINPWPDCYKGIRKANIILSRIGENKELTDQERRDYTGLAYFLRAYFYSSLLKIYGPVPILPDQPFDTDEPVANVSFERASFDDCVKYICENLENAAQMLPRDREVAFMYMPTRGAALALKARIQLWHASPLYNGNTYYANWTRVDGTPFISQVFDGSRWGKAAATFKRIIEMGKYELNIQPKIVISNGTGTLELPETNDPNLKTMTFPNGAAGIDPYKSYRSMFDGSVRPENNKELIYFSDRVDVDDRFAFPAGGLGGNSTLSVTQDMVDAFKMADGRQYSEATPAEKSGDAVGTGMVFSGDYILSAERARMHDNREPRFYAILGFNHSVWPSTSFRGTEPYKNFNATYYRDGNARGDNFSYNRTGYTVRKYINQEDINHWNSTKRQKVYPILRYAEVLLGYVEAMNEMTESYTDESGVLVSRNPSEIMKYFNQIRYRSGLPGITLAEASDRERLREIIKQEWQVEFFFEDHRYYDLRRWLDAPNAYRKPVTGLDVSASQSERSKFYTVRVWNTETAMKRVWSNKMYFFPISQSVLDKNGKLVQNPGW